MIQKSYLPNPPKPMREQRIKASILYCVCLSDPHAPATISEIVSFCAAHYVGIVSRARVARCLRLLMDDGAFTETSMGITNAKKPIVGYAPNWQSYAFLAAYYAFLSPALREASEGVTKGIVAMCRAIGEGAQNEA